MADRRNQLQNDAWRERKRRTLSSLSDCSRGCGDETQERQRLDSCGPVEAIELSGDDGAVVKTVMSSQEALTANHTALFTTEKRSATP